MKKSIKRIIALLFALIMVVSTIQPAAITNAANEPETIVYVSATGSDSNDGSAKDKAFKSLQKAVTTLGGVTGTKVIKIVGEYTVPVISNWKTIPEHTDMIIIEGADENAVFQADELYVKGPTTFQNIKLKYTSSNGRYPLFGAGNEVVFGNGVTCVAGDGVDWNLVMGASGSSGFVDGALIGTDRTFTISSGNYGDLTMGSHALTTGKTVTIPGLTAMLSGDASINNIYIGQYNRDSSGQVIANTGGKVNFTDDVNFIMNGGTVTGTIQDYLFNERATFTNGAALQLIFNNGASAALEDGLEGYIPNRGGTFYQLKCASATDGSILEPTAEAGTYQIVGDMIAVAKQDGEEVARSEGGILTVTAGVYDITWESATIEPGMSEVYVSADGDDSAAGTENAPVKTLEKAVQKTNGTDEATIYVKGQIDLIGGNNWAEIPTHTNKLTIQGVDKETSIINTDGPMINGPTHFKNITINKAGSSTASNIDFVAMGYEVTIGKNVQTTGQGRLNLISGGSGASAGQTATQTHKINVAGGPLYNLYLGYRKASENITIPGITATMDKGATATIVYIGQEEVNSASGTVTYTSNVNFIMNGGTLTNYVDITKKAVFADGAALQLIFNNGTKQGGTWTLDSTKSEATGANCKVYRLHCALADDGSILEPTEITGTYKVVGNMVAVAKLNGNEVARSENGLLTVASDGVYDITWEGETVEPGISEVYVSPDGDDNAAGSESAPVKTIEKAVQKTNGIDEATIYVKGRIELIGGNGWAEIPAHTNKLTIKGIDQETSVLRTDGLLVKGPTTFENITIEKAGSGEQSDIDLVAMGYEVSIGKDVLVTGTGHLNFISGGTGTDAGNAVSGAYAEPHKITVDSGKLFYLYLGYRKAGMNVTIPGITATINSGSQITIIAPGQRDVGSATGTVTFTKNVNVIMNGGTLTNYVDITKKATFAEGAALQLIFNNGIRQNGTWMLDSSKEEATGANCKVYRLHCSSAADGSILEPTETAGTYKVVGNMMAVATDGANEYRSVDGILTVPTDGTYDVIWTDKTGQIIPSDKMVYLDAAQDKYSSPQMFAQNVSLKKGHTYTISYKYNMVSSKMNDTFYVVVKDKLGSGNYKTHLSSYSSEETEFKTVRDKEKCTMTHTFTWQGETGDYGIGFTILKKTQMYIADYTVFDVNMPNFNLCASGSNPKDLFGWRNDWNVAEEGALEYTSGGYTAKLLQRDETLFKPKQYERKMIYLDAYQDKYKSAQMFAQNISLEKGETYTVSYKYKYVNAELNSTFYFQVKDRLGSDKYSAYFSDHFSGDRKLKRENDKKNSVVNFTFTWKEKSGDYGIGFTIIGKTQMYIADYTIYNVKDPKTNLCPSAENPDSLYGWRNDWQSAPVVSTEFESNGYKATLLTYDETAFAPDPKLPNKMVYIENINMHRHWAQRVTLEVGRTYRFSFGISTKMTPMALVMTDGEREKILSNLKPINEPDYTKDFYVLEYEFVMPASFNGKSLEGEPVFVGLQFNPGTNAYVFDPKLWDVSDPEKENLYKNPDFNKGMDQWTLGWGPWFIPSMTGLGVMSKEEEGLYKLEVMPYDETKFIGYYDDSRFNDGEWWSEADVAVETKRASRIKGVVVNAGGDGLSGVNLLLVSKKESFELKTDKNGKFSFEKIPAGFYELFILDDGAQIPTQFASNIKDDYTINVKVVYDNGQAHAELTGIAPLAIVVAIAVPLLCTAGMIGVIYVTKAKKAKKTKETEV